MIDIAHERFMQQLKGCQIQYDKLCKQNEFFRKKLQTYNKDEQIQKLKQQISDLRVRSFLIFSDKQKSAERAFRLKHYELHGSTRISGSRFIYDITGHGFGNTIIIQCPICNEREDITDMENW